MGIIFKNENENAEMLKILQQFQSYLQKSQKIALTLKFSLEISFQLRGQSMS